MVYIIFALMAFYHKIEEKEREERQRQKRGDHDAIHDETTDTNITYATLKTEPNMNPSISQNWNIFLQTSHEVPKKKCYQGLFKMDFISIDQQNRFFFNVSNFISFQSFPFFQENKNDVITNVRYKIDHNRLTPRVIYIFDEITIRWEVVIAGVPHYWIRCLERIQLGSGVLRYNICWIAAQQSLILGVWLTTAQFHIQRIDGHPNVWINDWNE